MIAPYDPEVVASRLQHCDVDAAHAHVHLLRVTPDGQLDPAVLCVSLLEAAALDRTGSGEAFTGRAVTDLGSGEMFFVFGLSDAGGFGGLLAAVPYARDSSRTM